jgi:hypothetical protein
MHKANFEKRVFFEIPFSFKHEHGISEMTEYAVSRAA